MRVALLVFFISALSAAGSQDLEYEEPTVQLTLLVRNKAHILPLFLSYVTQLDYPKQRIAIWLRCDHSNDESLSMLQQWLERYAQLYHSVNYALDVETQSYENETVTFDWPLERLKHLIILKEQALQHARHIWADFIFFLDADVLLTAPQSLRVLTRLQLPIVAPMLLSEGLYSNFWCGMTSEYYYQRTDEYKEIYHHRKVGAFQVPMVHTAVLVNLNYAATRFLTFDRQRLLELQHSQQLALIYNGPVDDIIVFAMSANSSGLPLHVSNELAFGYLTPPLDASDSLQIDLQQLINLRANMVHDLGAVPPLLDYLQTHVEKPPKTKLNVDNIFVINLLRRTERREKMERLFDELGLEVEHFAAVDGKELNAQRVREMGISFLSGYEDPYHHRPMTMGEIGCFLSHYRIWQQIVERQLEQVLILEDDIRFEPYFKSNAQRVLEQASHTDYDLIYFGRKRLKDEKEPWVAGTENLVHVGYSYWTLAYVITLRGAQKLLAVKPLEKLIPVDEFLPIMFDRHPQKDWSAAFAPRNLIAFSAAPLLLYPTHYTGDSGYISDTEDSQQVVVPEISTEAGDPQLKSDRQQIFAKEGGNNLAQDLKLGARQVQAKCFELLTEIANEHNGKVYDTLMLIMKLTFSMHIYPQGGEQISDWFINQIEVQPETIAKVLQFYIECVITNPIREWKPCDEKVAIGYAAKYDAALYAKCNKCCAKFLLDAVRADDAVGIQVRSLDLIERMLQQQVQVEWSLFRHDVSTMPREVALLRETIRSINDKTITVRRKACQVLNVILRQSCPITTRILNECISFVQFSDDHSTAGHLRPQPVQYAYSFEGAELLEPEVIKLPEVLYQRYLSAENGLARCAGISLLERLVLINPRIMYDTDFEQEMSRLAVDMLSSVRRAALDMVDNLLEAYCDCSILVRIYCRIWPCLLNDEDIALQKLAIQSFNRKVLRNIVALEYTNGPKQLLPWCILTTLLRLQPRDYLKQRLTILLQQEPGFVTLELVNTIISHLSTSMATEAWSLLLLLSSRIQNNLDVLINTLNRLSSCNNVFNQILAFQLISYCMPRFSKSALNQLFNRLCDALSTGSLCLPLVSPAILLLGHIDGFAHSQAPEDSTNPDDWKLNLLRRVTIGISECTHSLNDVVRLECLLGCYSDLIVMTSEETDMMVFDLALSYLKMYVQLDEANFDTRNERFMNWMVVVAGRLSLRDNNLAHRLANLYGLILTKNDRPQLVNSTLIALNDLGKKYPSILENNMQCILIKLNSKYSMTRVRTYRCVKDVILAGNIKLKGAILIALLSGLVDESVEVVREADAFFIRYQKLYDKLLFQHCLKEVPFDFNDQTFLNGSQRVDPNYSSPLKGRAMCKKRRLIYNHIIASLDHNTLLMYFGQLKLLAEKTKDKTFIKSTGAIDVVLDILFIMRRICLSTKTKRQGGAPAEGEQEAEVQEEAAVPVELHATATDKSTAKSRGRGGARKRDLGEEALKQLERSLRYVEETQRNLSSVMNAELQHEIDLMCKAMSMRFPSYTDFAQPAQFWKKYKHTKSTRGKPKRRNNDEPVDDQSTESNSESDSELPLDRHKHSVVLPEKLAERSNTMDYLATELLFQPH